MGIVKHFKNKWKTYSTKEKVIRIAILILFLTFQTTTYIIVADVWWESLMVGFTTGILILEILMKSPKKRYERIKLKYKIKKLNDLSKDEVIRGDFDMTFSKIGEFDYKIIMEDILKHIDRKEYRTYIQLDVGYLYALYIYKLKLTQQEKKERLQEERKQKLEKINE